MAMWWYDAFYTLLLYFYMLLMFSFVIYIEPHTTGSCPESTDRTPAVIAVSAVLFVVIRLAVAILTMACCAYMYTSESVMLEYVHCTYVQACVCICVNVLV